MRKDLVTTNDQKPTGPIEPQKLNVITTAIIPEGGLALNALAVAPKGTDLSKMITTADMGADIQSKMMTEIEDVHHIPAPPHKKAGRPKKA